MFKKLLLIALIFAGLNVNTGNAMETQEVLQVAAPKGGTIEWLKRFGVAYLCYKVICKAEAKTMDALFPLIEETLDESEATEVLVFEDANSEKAYKDSLKKLTVNNKNAVIRAVATLATLYGCYKLTNYLHQQISDEPYRWAHFFGATF